jgi:hypothetical protein
MDIIKWRLEMGMKYDHFTWTEFKDLYIITISQMSIRWKSSLYETN